MDAAPKDTQERAAAASLNGEYERAQKLLTQAQQIKNFIADLFAKQRDWQALIGKRRGQRKVKEKTKRLPYGQGRKETPSAREEAYHAFFQSLIDELRTKHSFTKARRAQPQNWYTFPTGFSGVTYVVAFSYGGRVRTELYLDIGENQ